MNNVFIVSAVRTPVGSFRGRLKGISTPDLGSVAIKGALQQAGVENHCVEEVIMGCAIQAGLGQGPARQAALNAGIPEKVPCTTTNKVCGSGLLSAISAARCIMLGEIDLAVAGGMENMSAVPYTLPNGRDGYRLGNGDILDLILRDGLLDAYSGIHMGTCMDRIAEAEGISREVQDDWAIRSYQRAIEACQNGHTQSEIVPVPVSSRQGTTMVAEDEGPTVFDEEKMRRLKPAFRPEGTITAGNASSINDGAAAMVLASEAAMKREGLTPLARIVSFAYTATTPSKYPYTPIDASRRALEKAGLGVSDIDFFEVNEAFAAIIPLTINALKLPAEKVNPFGGAVSLGHPIGASGARIVSTLLNVLRTKGGKRGLATLCVGGGEGVSMIVERP
jgi:acetyl-CoA C-acetyltransferase